LRNLTLLSLQETQLDDRGLEALLRSPNLQGVRTLDLNFNPIRTGLAPLLDPTFLPRLVECRWGGSDVEPELSSRLRKRFPRGG
jgi:hypothetical protein